MSALLDSMNKDLVIIILFIIIIACMLIIRRLKKQLAYEVYQRLHPQLSMELIDYTENEDHGIYIKNESFFLLKDIEVQDINPTLTDSGFTQKLVVKFDQIDFLKPKERIKLICKAFDKQNTFLPNITESIIPHLLNISFPVQIRCSTADGRSFLASFIKKRDKFYEERIEILQ